MGLTALPPELLVRLNRFVDYPEHTSLAGSCRYLDTISKCSAVWRAKANDIEFHVPQDTKAHDVRSLVRNHIIEIITQVLTDGIQIGPITIQNVNRAKKARDTIVVWKELASIDKSLDFDQIKTKKPLEIIDEFDKWIDTNREKLQDIKNLWLHSKNLKFLPASLGKLKNLEKLHLPFNDLEDFPEFIADLTNLRMLDIKYNNLKVLPDWINNLQKLEKLNCENNQIESIPDTFGDLENLKKTDLRDNKLKTLPISIGRLKNLKKLDCYNNELESLPDSFVTLQNLTELNISMNKFKSIPSVLKDLLKLKTLDIGSNYNIELHENDFIGSFKNLETLQITHTSLSLTSLPESIGGLNNLKVLDLKYNSLKSLPDSIGELEDLQEINLSGHKFTSLPISFKKLIDRGVIIRGLATEEPNSLMPRMATRMANCTLI